MTKRDYIKQADPKELAAWLCDLINTFAENQDDIEPGRVFPHHCRSCPAQRTCQPGHNGFLDYLEQEEADA